MFSLYLNFGHVLEVLKKWLSGRPACPPWSAIDHLLVGVTVTGHADLTCSPVDCLLPAVASGSRR